MNRKQIVLVTLLGIFYVIYHCLSLGYSPLPWFDEICFASTTQNYLRYSTLFDTSRSLSIHQQVLAYGPVYFVVQRAVGMMFGFGIYTFRFVNLFFGFADLFLVYNISNYFKFSVNAIIVTLLIIALDPSFNQDSHSGRMDFVAVFFFLLSLIAFIKIKSGEAYIILSAISGVLLSFAFLTTPRVVFTFPVFLSLMIYELYTARKNELYRSVFLKYIIMATCFSFFFLLWVYAKFDGIQGYISYFSTSPVLMKHIGSQGSFSRITYHTIISLYSTFIFLYAIRKRQFHNNAKWLLICISAIISFAIVVRGVSDIYGSMLIPFQALLIAGSMSMFINNKIFKYASYGLISVFACIFIFKMLFISLTFSDRNPKNFQAITNSIPQNVTVFGDYQYYYIIQGNNDDFQSMQENGSIDEIKTYLLQNKVPFVVLNKNKNNDTLYKKYLSENYVLTAVIENNHTSILAKKLLAYLPIHVSDSYACCVYKYKGG